MPTGRKSSGVYHKLSDFFRERFGAPAYRIPVDGGFSCPNRDGMTGTGPCAFCDERGSGARHLQPEQSIRDQFLLGCDHLRRKRGVRHFIGYFQSFTATWGDTRDCIRRYRALLDAGADGLAIGTRPDCLAPDLLAWLGDVSRTHLVMLDLGVQSMTDRVLHLVDRGHAAADTWKALERIAAYPEIHTCVHLIFGLPDERRDEMMASVSLFTDGGAKGVKFHQLNILSGTKMEQMYREGRVTPLSLQQYVELVTDFLERIPDDVVVHRISARADDHTRLIAPDWGKFRLKPTQHVVDEFMRRGTRQGFFSDTSLRFSVYPLKPDDTGGQE